jgi:hypothetical protein
MKLKNIMLTVLISFSLVLCLSFTSKAATTDTYKVVTQHITLKPQNSVLQETFRASIAPALKEFANDLYIVDKQTGIITPLLFYVNNYSDNAPFKIDLSKDTKTLRIDFTILQNNPDKYELISIVKI